MPSTRIAVLAAASLAASACAGGARTGTSAPSGTSADISEADLRTRLFVIAHDSMMGRQTGSEGAYKTADYVAREFRRLGLEPAGDNVTYFQAVPFWIAAVDGASSLRAGDVTLTVERDFLPMQVFAEGRTLRDVPVVYGGPALDSTQWISTTAAAGKLVVLDVPPGTALRGLPLGAARWAGAVAVVAPILDNAPPEQVARLRWGRPIADTTRNARLMPTLWVTRRAATALLGGDPATLAPGATGVRVTGRFDISRIPTPFPARNVVAVLRGSDPTRRGQYLSLTAHNDHVGYDHSPVDHDSLRAVNRVIRPMGADSPPREPTAAEARRIRTILDSLRRLHAPRLDSIRNGADDDGSGTVALLEIAEAFASAKVRPARSILFVNHTGEEDGLVGSAWYTTHPTVPLDSIVAEIDEDMTGRGARDDFPRDNGRTAADPQYLEVIGARRLSREFGDTLEAANARQPLPFRFDYTYDADGHPLQYYCRADHYNYAKHGIPAVAFSRGEHLDYHQVTDEPQYINYPDMARVTRMVFEAARAIGNMTHRPVLSVPKPTNPNAPCRQ